MALLPLKNEGAGFQGTLRGQDFSASDIQKAYEKCAEVVKRFLPGIEDEDVRNFFDSAHGRHIADRIADGKTPDQAFDSYASKGKVKKLLEQTVEDREYFSSLIEDPSGTRLQTAKEALALLAGEEGVDELVAEYGEGWDEQDLRDFLEEDLGVSREDVSAVLRDIVKEAEDSKSGLVEAIEEDPSEGAAEQATEEYMQHIREVSVKALKDKGIEFKER